MSDEIKEISVLGKNYKIIVQSEDKEPRLKENWGFCDYYTKEIYLSNDLGKETEDSCKNQKDFYNKVVRHEILHAFLYESGLRENSRGCTAWAENEEMVDWIAIQFPKLLKVYEELNIL